MPHLDELLRVIRDEGKGDIPEDRVWSAIQSRLAQGPPPPPVSDAGVGTALTGSGVTLKAIAGLVVVLGSVVIFAPSLSAPPASPAAVEAVAPAVAAASPSVPNEAVTPSEAVLPVPDEAAERPPEAVDHAVQTPRRRRSDPRPKPVEPSPPPPEVLEDFQAELRLLADMKAAFKHGDHRLVLQMADDHVRRFGARGQLVQERLVHMVEASCALGRVDDARRHADELLSKWPNSTYARRTRVSCAGL